MDRGENERGPAPRALCSGIGALCSFARLKRQRLKRSESSPRAMLEGKHPRGAPTALTTALDARRV
jgi:hypothetical protein